MTAPVDDDFSELRDADIPRIDLVDKAANGLRFLIAKREDGEGLMDPEFVRDLIGKSEPASVTDDGETVTMTGSPAAIVKLIHQAAQRQADGHVEKAEMSAADINDLPDSAFAYIESGGTKDEQGRTSPRSLRHFPIHDEAHVRNALSRAPQSPFGDEAMPKIRAAAKKFGIEVSKMTEPDEATGILDPTVPLAVPDGQTQGDPAEPGSPAWEAIDAATARKWTAILVRAKNALGLLAEREMVEAATGADPGDVEAAWDLQDAQCAIACAIDVLAGFAVEEQAEADLAGEAAQAVGKALSGFDPNVLDTIEGLAPVVKAGRVLSSANEAAIRGAVESLQKVLASLPAAPITDDEEAGQPVTKQEETVADIEAVPAEQTTHTEPVVKADGEKTPQVPIYDAKGRLVGVVSPDQVIPVASMAAEEDTADVDEPSRDDGGDGAGEMPADGAPETADLEPAPAAEVGIPADAVPDGVAKQTDTDNPTNSSDTLSDVLKGSITDMVNAQLAAHSATQEQVIAKQAADLAAMAETVETLKGQIRVLEEQPAEPKVFTSGAVPPAHHLRGQDRGAVPVDVAKAAELKKTLYAGTAPEQNEAAQEMQAAAIARLQEIHQRR